MYETGVKICGLKDEASLEAAIAAGADYVGFVHFPKSPRHVDLATAARLATVARASEAARSVVLLVDPDDDLLARVDAEVAPDIVQLHGRESLERVAEVENLVRAEILKAAAVATRGDVEAAAPYLAPGFADMLLFDAKPPPSAELPGGNGLSFDWSILDGLADAFPFWLAGGLTPENVAEAVRLTRAAVVDVSSGVETAPGVKDAAKMQRFVSAAKDAGQNPR